MLHRAVVIYLVIFIEDCLCESKSRLDIRGTILPPCNKSAENPFQFNGNLVKVDEFSFSFNGTFVGDRRLRPPTEVKKVKFDSFIASNEICKITS